MKNILAGAAFAAVATQAGAAPAPDISTVNPNAIVQVLLEQATKAAGRQLPMKPFKDADDVTLVCRGEIPKSLMITDRKGQNIFMSRDPYVPDIVKFAFDPNARDKAGQEKVRTLLETRKDLAYLQYDSVFGPDPKEIESYLGKSVGAKIYDIDQRGTAFRDASMKTTILMDSQALEKFVTANAAQIKAVEVTYQQDKYARPNFYTACGPSLNK